MGTISYEGWQFYLGEPEPIFGKLKIVAMREELEEVFYVYGEELTEAICQELYEHYLYAYASS